ncbi:MAG: aminotransferase class V-fold PLP-dependent enzyme, partial [Methylophilaceae bacterium]
MTTSNFNDLSSFEPEAILAALPGEHPRMAAALAVGREASQGGHLDVAKLARIANEIYAEGFPLQSPFAAAPPQIPSTASMPDAATPFAVSGVAPSAGNGLGLPELNQLAQLPIKPEVPSQVAELHAYQLQYAPEVVSDLDIRALLGGVDVPCQSELNALLGGFTPNTSSPAGPVATPGSPSVSSKATDSNFYFIKPVAGHAAGIASSAHPPFDANLIRKDFPILSELVNGRPLIWLDNAATTQKPQSVIDRLAYFYQHENSNIHRAAHELAARATDAYEGAREKVRHFINAPSVDNIVFVRGTTEAINLVAKT